MVEESWSCPEKCCHNFRNIVEVTRKSPPASPDNPRMIKIKVINSPKATIATGNSCKSSNIRVSHFDYVKGPALYCLRGLTGLGMCDFYQPETRSSDFLDSPEPVVYVATIFFAGFPQILMFPFFARNTLNDIQLSNPKL